jgi:hypothetical protein
MIRKLLLASALVAGGALAVTSPATAWTAVGPHGGWVHGGGWYHGGWRGCCWGGGAVAAGLAVGTAVGVAAASRPAYVTPAPVYVPPRAVYVAPPPVVYGPGYYYVR